VTVAFYIFINAVFWVAVHLLSGYLVHLFPEKIYRLDNFLFKISSFERGGIFYRRYFLVHRWKDRLPEAGQFFSRRHFSKRRLEKFTREYLLKFALETCRAELAHFLPFLFYPLCLFWNPCPGDIIMFAYAFLANVPCIIVQRYNRARIIGLSIFCKK